MLKHMLMILSLGTLLFKHFTQKCLIVLTTGQ